MHQISWNSQFGATSATALIRSGNDTLPLSGFNNELPLHSIKSHKKAKSKSSSAVLITPDQWAILSSDKAEWQLIPAALCR